MQSGTWTLRRFATAFEHDADGFLCDPADLASEIGLGRGIGANAPITRTLARLSLFDLVRRAGDQLHVRRRVPELNRRQVARLPEHLGRSHEHRRSQAENPATVGEQQRRARMLAAVLAEIGDRHDTIENTLHGWRIEPSIAADAAGWAWSRRMHPSSQPALADDADEDSATDAA